MLSRSIWMSTFLLVGFFFSSHAFSQEDQSHLKRCDSIYHQNVGCPGFGIVKVPQKVKEQQDAEHLKWCDSIYHQNVGCPGFGKVKVPEQVKAQQDAEHLKWCDSIYHQNVGCPKFGKVKVPDDVRKRDEAKHLQWCESINHANVGCPKFSQKRTENEAREARQQQSELREWCAGISFAATKCQTLLDPSQVSAQADRALSGSKGTDDQRVHAQATQKIWGFEQGSWGYSILEKLGVGKPSAGSAR